MPELERLRLDHGPAVLAFERENREFFASLVPDRGDDYFQEFDVRHKALLAEQAEGICQFHVLVENGEVLGRFNLMDLVDGAAHLGYRLAERATGKGLATGTVRSLCELAVRDYGLHTLRAATTEVNTASQAVLTRVGFTRTGRTTLDGLPGLTYTLDLTTV
ncbi:GNAT family N-acetyltransferase [Kribbella deserti]|uniref:GNAT family N-acetyltransferase n=1 Tax=Kribbella deserti TaxID=1926257 RepID=A0ABV6QWZ4_9ACTN